jgi:hypothetical protein
MKKSLQKIIATALVATSLLTVSQKALAATTLVDTTNKFIGSDNVVYDKIPEVTPEEFQKALDKAIQIEVEKVKDPKESKSLDSNLKEIFSANKSKYEDVVVLYNVRNEDGGSGVLLESSDSWVPNIHIENIYVAQAVNTFINAILISIGVGSVSVALNRYG